MHLVSLLNGREFPLALLVLVFMSLSIVSDSLVQLRSQAAYAKGTYSNLRSQWRAYLRFTLYFGLKPVPASPSTVMMFAQFQSKTMTVASIKNYVAGIHTLHKYLGLPFPPLDDFYTSLFFKGLTKSNPHIPHQALPITPAILLKIYHKLNFADPFSSTLWCACLFAFFSFARKSNLLPPVSEGEGFENSKHITRGHISVCKFGLLVTFTWSKTLQSGGCSLQITICAIPSPLSAFNNMISLFPASVDSPAFLIPSILGLVPLTQSVFVDKLRTILFLLKLPAASYSGHSFRRGGASWAFHAGVPGELVKLLGDWRSDAYLRYLDTPLESRLSVSTSMAKHIVQTT